jgi:hypothetical protein
VIDDQASDRHARFDAHIIQGATGRCVDGYRPAIT